MIKYLITIILVIAIFFIAMIIYGAIMRPQLTYFIIGGIIKAEKKGGQINEVD